MDRTIDYCPRWVKPGAKVHCKLCGAFQFVNCVVVLKPWRLGGEKGQWVTQIDKHPSPVPVSDLKPAEPDRAYIECVTAEGAHQEWAHTMLEVALDELDTMMRGPGHFDALVDDQQTSLAISQAEVRPPDRRQQYATLMQRLQEIATSLHHARACASELEDLHQAEEVDHAAIAD